MKSILFLIISCLITNVAIADKTVEKAALDSITITSVNVKTPLPTFHESTATTPSTDELAAIIFNNKLVKPILKTAYSLHGEEIVQNLLAGPLFYQQGYFLFDCDINPIGNLPGKEDKCGFELTKSAGWYADIRFAFVVRGYISKKLLPKKVYSEELGL